MCGTKAAGPAGRGVLVGLLFLAAATADQPPVSPDVNAAVEALAAQLAAGVPEGPVRVAPEDFTVGDTREGGRLAREVREALETALPRTGKFRVVAARYLYLAPGTGYLLRGRLIPSMEGVQIEAWLDRPGSRLRGAPKKEKPTKITGIRGLVDVIGVRGVVQVAGGAQMRGLEVERVQARAAAMAGLLEDSTAGDPEFWVTVWSPRGTTATYEEGEAVQVYLLANRDCMVSLVYVDAAGRLKQIFPNEFARSGAHLLTAGKVYEIPAPGDAFRFTITPPFGVETMKAMATTARPDRDIPPPRADSLAKAESEVRRVRGIMVEAARQAGSAASYTEHSCAITTIPRKARP